MFLINKGSRYLSSLFFLSFFCGANAFAGQSNGGYIGYMVSEITNSGAPGYEFTVTNTTGSPACSAASGKFVTVNKEQMAVVLAAKMAKAKISVGGANTCNTHGNAETVTYIIVMAD